MTGNDAGSGTRREAGTRREGGAGDGGSVAGGTRREGGEAVWSRVNLPPELAGRFRIVEELGSGGEGFVLRVVDSVGLEFVVKLYRPGLSFDERAVALLGAADRDHVLEVAADRAADGSRYEVLEWCAFGSLRDLLERGFSCDVNVVVAELAGALEHIHGLRLADDPDARLVHQDLKPENVMVRSLEPFDLVLGDFGLARMIAGSRHITNRQQGSRAWAPPSGEAVTAGWDWWSFGMIVAEVAGGRHPFCVDGQWLSDAAISDLLSQGPVDLSAVTDARVLMLCRGLLTRRTAGRWGADEVRRWLAGESVPVVADTGGAERRQRSVLFNGTEYHDSVALAAALQQDWDQAQELLIQRTDGGALSQQVALLLSAAGLADAEQLLKDSSNPPTRLANLLVEMDPDLSPIYRGNDIRPVALLSALTSSESPLPVVRLIEDPKTGLIETGVMTAWRHLQGMTDAPTTQPQLRQARDFLGQHDSTLRKLQRETVEAIKVAAYAVALNADSAEATRASLRTVDSSKAEKQAWWAKLAAGTDPYSPVLALLTEPFAREQTDREIAEKQAAREAARRNEEARAREQREQDRARARLNARNRRRQMGGILKGLFFTALFWVAFSLFFTLGPPASENQKKYGISAFAGHTNKEALILFLTTSAIGLILILIGGVIQIPRDPVPYARDVYLGWGCTLGVVSGLVIFGFGIANDMHFSEQTKQVHIGAWAAFPVMVGLGALVEGVIRRARANASR
jgi:serine/threonine protein kinase